MILKAPLFAAAIISVFFAPGQNIIKPIDGWSIKQMDDGAILSPGGSTLNKPFTYTIQKTMTKPAGKQNWFEETVAADQRQQGFTETKKSDVKTMGDVKIYMTVVNDASKQQWFVCYMGYTYASTKARIARIMGADWQEFEQYSNPAGKHFAALAMKEGVDKDAVVRDGEQKQRTETKANTSTPDKNEPLLKMNGGLKPADIHNVILHLEYRAGVGGGIYPVYVPYILLKDGTIYGDPSISPYDMNIPLSKETEPRQWGKWKMEGSTIKVHWPSEKKVQDQNQEWKSTSYHKANGAQKDEKLTGTFKSLSGTGNTAIGGDVMVAVVENIAFNNTGQFTLDKAASVTGSGPWETSTANSNKAGTYFLNGYMIELRFNNGQTERRFFYFYPNAKTHFGIGGSVYRPMKK